MDFNALLQYLPLLLQVLNASSSIKDTIATGGSVDTVISKLIPQALPLLQAIGQQFFPKVAVQLSHVAAVDVIFDNDGTKWVQNGLNALGASPQLTVDGDYGPATRSAVSAYQTKNGLKVDGWAGPKTSASIAVALTKLPPAPTP